ncbi:MAG: fibronectin type III domain-containing protein, partial [Bacteroidales bacterium]|nr:fibronectin type III domain-containing protein [Bacteroidales bacterium]
MKMRRVIMIISGIVLIGQAYSQNSLNDLNVILKNNFEDNTLGTYLVNEYNSDWMNPPWNSRQSTTKIESDDSNIENSSNALKIFYPANSLGPDEGGAQWWTYLPKKYDEIYVSYDLMFMPGFQFQKGGKLPSVKGGTFSSGVNMPDGYNGFSGGLMFKENGEITFYIYYPDSKVPDYGDSFRWGTEYTSTAFEPSSIRIYNNSSVRPRCVPGKWYNITYRMVLNTINTNGKGNYDGILEAYFDGKLVTQVSNILFRHTTSLGIDCMRLYTFFGGNTDEWRNPISEWMKIDNVLLFTYKDEINVPRGNKLSSTDRLLNYWRNFKDTPANLTEPYEFKSTAHTTSTITLNWEDKSSNEQGFQLERTTSININGDFEPIAKIAANTNSYTDTGLYPDRMYYYRIKAFNSTGSSSYATLQQATSPVLPTNAEKAGFVEIFANASEASNRRALPVTMLESGIISGITIYHNGGAGKALLGIYSTYETLPGQRIAITSPTPVNTSAGWQTFKLTAPVEVSKGSTIWLAWVFENGISLRYTSGEPGRAQSEETYAGGMPEVFGGSEVSASVYSIYANYVPVPTPAKIPDPPSNLHLTQSDHASATIGWNDNAQNEIGFEIERINTADDTRKTFAMESNAVKLEDNSLAENTTYQYRIRAFNAEGSSAWSELLTVMTPQKETDTPVVTEPVDPANNRPVMTNQQFNISEQSLKDNILGSVAASDPDGQK